MELPDPTPVLLGLAALITALGTFVNVRNKRAARNARELRKVSKQLSDAYLHIYRLNEDLARHGIEPDPLPPSLIDEDREDDDE